MKKVDENRRNILKGMAAFSALAMFGNTLYADKTKKVETLVLLNNSAFASDFEKGVNKVEANSNLIEKIDLIADYASFDALLKKHLSSGNLEKITGLLTQGDYVLLVEKLKDSKISLKAEISHNISNSGTKHYITTVNTASGIISNAKRTLDQNDQWAFLSGYILGGSSADLFQNSVRTNSFEKITISRNECGNTNLISFLATIKEKQYV